MKTNRGFSDINQFLGISLTDLASSLNISATFLSQIGHDKREFSTPLFQKFREFHMVILRIQAENPVGQTDGTTLFSPNFLQNRLLDIDKELRSLDIRLGACLTHQSYNIGHGTQW